MRVKHITTHLNFRAKARLVWTRITFSRLTTTYFILAIIHCLVQVTLQGQGFAANSSAALGLFNLLKVAGDADEIQGFAIFDNGLRICYELPKSIQDSSCPVIWTPDNSSSGVSPLGLSLAVSLPSSSSSSALPTVTSSTESLTVTSPVLSLSVPTAVPSLSSGVKAVSVPTTPIAEAGTLVITPSEGGQPTTIVVASPTSTKKPDNDDDDDDDTDRNLKATKLSTDNAQFFNITGLTSNTVKGVSQTNAVLTDTCISTLLWPAQKLSNTLREDLTLIGFQVSVLGMSIVALLNESIPHVLAALFTHLVATIWSIAQVFQTEDFRQDFFRLIVNGACSGNNLLGSYWQERKKAEIASAVVNTISFIVTAFLTYKLTRTYGWQTFKRVGASIKINRMYKLVLSLSIAIQLALFFIVAAAALWIDQLCNGSVGHLSKLANIYKAGIIIMFVLLVPWLTLGWFAIRREMRKSCLAFLGLSIIFIGLWAAMFDSISFRWTFMLWPFFAVMAIVSGTLIVLTFILGLACRFNFGKGLPHYLNSEEPLDGDDFDPVYPDTHGGNASDHEKVDYPSVERPVPTFSAAFGGGDEALRPADTHFSPPRGPEGMFLQQSEQVHSVTRSFSTSSSMVPEVHLARSDTQSSAASDRSDSTTSSINRAKRWVIE
ncbi:hypothetical protein BU17DRAFT_38723 [Hysterangium stoloniferum]|nr:hypothetical protein BU17DRAFT_38723 [Hysterangium stoloniferum]